MKIIAFFSEKGGVGKSTFSLMMASWLHKHGVKVGVADYNKRLTEYRKDEILAMKNNGIYDEEIVKNAWPLIPVDKKFVAQFGSNNPGYAIWLEHLIKEGEFKGLDVVIADLPGAISGKEIIHLVLYKLVNLVIIPFDKDQQAMGAALSVKNFLRQVDSCRYCGFLNMVQTAYGKKEDYHKIMKAMEKHKLPILPDMISFSERMKAFEKVDMMRSTFSYPDWNAPAYKGSKDLGIENLFIDITREMIKIPDFRGTEPANLSFIESLAKDDSVQSLNRQLNGTSFPEYEIELPEEMKLKFKKNR